MELLIMAAGMGSRFGGLKQIEPMGPNGEFIIDYSIYDAVKEGFTKVIFAIKEENYEIFKKTIGKRIESIIPVEYAFQKKEEIPDFVKIPETREKPWGTAQTIWCARNLIKEPFLVINADDFYGRDAFKVAMQYLKQAKEKEYATIAYKVANTMTENGSVKRGIIAESNGQLVSITESRVENKDGHIIASPLSGKEPFEVSKGTPVSMNLLTFDLTIFEYLEKRMKDFFIENKDNLSECEFLIPDVMNDANKEGFAKVQVLKTDSSWYGVTYKEDKENVKKAINKLIEEKEYPENLWSK